MAKSSMRPVFLAVPYLVLFAGLVYELQAVLARCQGRFIYSLDDPYIHLALAERIAAGHYGINLAEVSAPSSSILWPFLLAPFARASFFEYLPLILNAFCAVLAVFVYTKVVQTVIAGPRSMPQVPAIIPTAGVSMQPLSNTRAAFAVMVLVVFLIPTTNLIGLAFTGMEHTLQVLLCAVIIFGLIVLECQAPAASSTPIPATTAPAWLVAAIILAPLVRFECLALSVPALGVLALRRRFRAAAIGAAGLALGLAAFSLFLHGQGLGWLPTSIAAKTAYFTPGADLGYGYGTTQTGVVNTLLQSLNANLEKHQGKLMALMLLVMLLFVTRRGGILAWFGALMLTLALVFGQVGWWERYEVYAVTSAVLLLLYLFRARLVHLFSAPLPVSALLIACLGSLVAGVPYYINFVQTPLSSANIYEQQYQMHRFAVDFYRAPVAVNDLGWMTFRNPYPVLDLWGLASREALDLRTHSREPGWMDELTRARGVRLAMIYDHWFPQRPPTWQPLARLHLGQPLAYAGTSVVTIYALDPATAARTLPLLHAFETTLPPGVRLEYEENETTDEHR